MDPRDVRTAAATGAGRGDALRGQASITGGFARGCVSQASGSAACG